MEGTIGGVIRSTHKKFEEEKGEKEKREGKTTVLKLP